MDNLAERFEQLRPQLRAVAGRMLGSAAEADDAVQETWLRLSRADAAGIDSLPAWSTTVVTRICLNLLRARAARREDPYDPYVPDPVLERGPEQEALLGDAVGLALQVVLEALGPAERVAFVLHDMFAVPYGEIAAMLDRTPAAARQLASRGRRRVRAAAAPGTDRQRQRELADAFFAAARAGDVERLVGLLHPGVVLRSDAGPGRGVVVRGARTVAQRASMLADPAARLEPVLVNGGPGAVVRIGNRLHAVIGFTVDDGTITAIDMLLDPDRLARVLG
jgi:RNA polymerase sigma factor (sigma-70 family)